jgi:hypothetical protein
MVSLEGLVAAFFAFSVSLPLCGAGSGDYGPPTLGPLGFDLMVFWRITV